MTANEQASRLLITNPLQWEANKAIKIPSIILVLLLRYKIWSAKCLASGEGTSLNPATLRGNVAIKIMKLWSKPLTEIRV